MLCAVYTTGGVFEHYCLGFSLLKGTQAKKDPVILACFVIYIHAFIQLIGFLFLVLLCTKQQDNKSRTQTFLVFLIFLLDLNYVVSEVLVLKRAFREKFS